MTVQYIILFLMSFHLFAMGDVTEWEINESQVERVDLIDLKFSNRARCALESEKPAKSVFAFVNNVDMAKALYRVAKVRGVDAEKTVKLGIDRFRYSVTELIHLIHSKIVEGRLPFLPEEIKDNERLHEYASLMKTCRTDQYCPALDDYLEKLWNLSDKYSYKENRSAFKEIDGLSKRNFFLEKRGFEKWSDNKLTCHYIKKFGPLQAHLYGTKPDKGVLKQIAQSAFNQADYLGRCDDFEGQDNLEVATYQFEIPDLKDYYWNKKGFEYWQTMKLYFSWAWRKSKVLESMAGEFTNIFRGVIIEDAVMLTPNGCQSITKPKCSSDYVAQNVMRELAKNNFKEKALKLDILDSLPEGPENDLLENEFPKINLDELELGNRKDSVAWLNEFTKNVRGTQAHLKKKLLRSLTKLNLVTKNISVETLVTQLSKQFEGLGSFNAESIDVDKTITREVRNELYYLCSEFNFIDHDTFSFIKENLKILQESTIVDGMTQGLDVVKTAEAFEYYKKLADVITTSCEEMNQLSIWDDNFQLDKSGYREWYTFKVFDGEIESQADKKRAEALTRVDSPMLAFNSYSKSLDPQDIICVDASNCARDIAEAIIDFYGITQYAHTFWNFKSQLKSPALFNPYAERTACKVYDPWYKTKATLYGFLADITQAAVSATTPGIVYTRSYLAPGRVTSFKKMVKNGEIVFDANYKKSKVQWGLGADFGPLLGVPCAVAVSKTDLNPYNTLYRFNGVSVGACKTKEDYNVNVRTASNITDDHTIKSGCMSCQLNFERVSTAITGFTEHWATKFFLVRSIYRLYKAFKDPDNFPRDWTTDLNHALDTYRKYGDIPDSCVRRLRRGLPCLSNRCEEAVVREVRSKLNGTIEGITDSPVVGYRTKVKLSSCEVPIKVSVRDHRGHCTARVSRKLPNSCKGIMK